MTDQNHPITPPHELVEQWIELPISLEEILDVAVRWGADQELEACCKTFEDVWDGEDFVTLSDFLRGLRAARRPKPPSLKEQAIKGFHTISQFVLDEWSGCSDYKVYKEITDTIFHALEQLDD